jgi:hypothetical protein
MHKRRNKQRIRQGQAVRVTHVPGGRRSGEGFRILPLVDIPHPGGPVDAERTAADLARLIELHKRASAG